MPEDRRAEFSGETDAYCSVDLSEVRSTQAHGNKAGPSKDWTQQNSLRNELIPEQSCCGQLACQTKVLFLPNQVL